MIILQAQEENSSSNWVHVRIILIIPPLICQCFRKLMKDNIAILKMTKGLPRWLGGQESTCQCRKHGFYPGSEDPLEEEMATHSSILAQKIPWTEEPDRLQALWCQRVRHGWAHMYTRKTMGRGVRWCIRPKTGLHAGTQDVNPSCDVWLSSA